MREAGLGSMARSKTLSQAGYFGASQYEGSKDNASPATTKTDIEAAAKKKELDAWNKILEESEKSLADLRAKKAKEDADAAKAKAEAEKKALAEAEKAAKEKERQQEIAEKQIADMEHELKMQQMINDGKKREAAIEDEIYRAKQRSSELTDAQIAQIEDMAGQLYDLKEKEDATTATARGGSSRVGGRDDTTTAMERMGAILGGVGGANSQTLRIQNEHVRVSRESLRVLNKISDKTGDAAIGSV
jgi:colicin import membrane protein